MANRPAQLRYLQKDKAIGAHTGFVETWNWLLSSFNNLKGGKGVKLEWKSVDHPVIELDENDGDGDGGGGAVTVTGTDGSSATGTSITFASADDSNVKASVSGEDGAVTVEIGVYWS